VGIIQENKSAIAVVEVLPDRFTTRMWAFLKAPNGSPFFRFMVGPPAHASLLPVRGKWKLVANVPGQSDVAVDVASQTSDGRTIVTAVARALMSVGLQAMPTHRESACQFLRQAHVYSFAAGDMRVAARSGELLADELVKAQPPDLDGAQEVLERAIAAAKSVRDDAGLLRLRLKLDWVRQQREPKPEAETQPASANTPGFNPLPVGPISTVSRERVLEGLRDTLMAAGVDFESGELVDKSGSPSGYWTQIAGRLECRVSLDSHGNASLISLIDGEDSALARRQFHPRGDSTRLAIVLLSAALEDLLDILQSEESRLGDSERLVTAAFPGRGSCAARTSATFSMADLARAWLDVADAIPVEDERAKIAAREVAILVRFADLAPRTAEAGRIAAYKARFDRIAQPEAVR